MLFPNGFSRKADPDCLIRFVEWGDFEYPVSCSLLGYLGVIVEVIVVQRHIPSQ